MFGFQLLYDALASIFNIFNFFMYLYLYNFFPCFFLHYRYINAQLNVNFLICLNFLLFNFFHSLHSVMYCEFYLLP